TLSSATGNKTATAKSDVATIEVVAKVDAKAPTIQAQPQSNNYTIGDAPAPLSITASTSDGGSLSYQWYKGNDIAIENATSSTFTPPTETVGAENYYCVVTNTLSSATGNKTATAKSDVATIEVTNKTAEPVIPVIIKNLSTDEIIYEHQILPEKLEIQATISDEGILSYQWYKDDAELIGEISNTYIPSTSDVGSSTYFCIATNTLNGKTATAKSNIATITIEKTSAEGGEPQEPIIDAQLPIITKDLDKNHIDTTINQGSINLLIEAQSQDGGVLSYQWIKDGIPIALATSNALTIDTSQVGTHLYKCLITNTLDSATGNKIAVTSSKTASITVEAKETQTGNDNGTTSKPDISDDTADKDTTPEQPVEEIIEIILPNPGSDITEVPGTEDDYIYGKDNNDNIFDVDHTFDKDKNVHIVKILSDYMIIKSNVPLNTTIENPMINKNVIDTGAVIVPDSFSKQFVKHFCLDGYKKLIKFYTAK
ncbi:MAG: hypothetical protein RSF81_08565, partial [Oscillospiraceae bacterium]